MSLVDLLKNEFKGFGKIERVLFPLILFFTVIISVLIKDNKIALVSAICGMSYTILAGKGRVSCYFIGMIGTFCYSYLSFVNGFYGNLALYMLYYFPLELVGIYKWSKHLKKDAREIYKTKLSIKDRYIYSFIILFFSAISSIILYFLNGANPIIDGTTMVMSIVGQILTVRRCVEQWYVWFFVNLLSLIMWIFAYINGSNCLATVIMWAVYLVLSVYFLKSWQKEID